ncbi:hypothetical protein NW762_014480 [Fusarium torreyae]|uniref:DUF8035 domain-containing protein n=1 Tax=Fusarium torreyae TaxID=1237075 RepID=A0A9W8RIM0_9HYPO|nr:hypothetical protein NW762_014480 [Fusarium torreyae]
MTFEDEIFCPICRETLCSMKEYQRHVGRHQEQLALFALPSISSPEDGENVEDNSVLSQSDVASEYMVKDDGKSSSHHADLIKELGNLKVEIEELGHLKDEIEECRRRRALEDGHTDDEARRLARHERERVELALQEKIQRDLYEPYNDKSLIGDGTPMPDGLDLDVDGISRAQDHSHKSTPQDFSDSHSHAPIAVPDNPSQDSAPIPIGADNSPSIASEIAQLEMQFRTKNPNLSLEQAHLLATEHMTRATLAQRQPAVNAAADILYGQREAEIFKTIEEKSKVAERQKKVEETLHLGTEATIEVQGGNSGKETKRAKPEAEEEVLEERIASEKGASALTAAIEKARREFGAEAAVAVHKKQDTARIRGQQKAEAAREMTESDTDEKLSVIYKDLRPESHKEEQSNTRKSSNPEPVPGGVVGVVVSEERARAMHRVVPSYGFQSIADTNNALNWTREPNQPATMPSSDATPGIQPTMPYSRPQTPPQEPVALISGEASSSESGSQDLSTREKILNSLLKKYPRRIRPKTEDEMARRLEELGSGLEDPDKEVGFKEEPESMSESFNRNTASDLSKHQVQGLVSSQTREPTGRETLRGVLKQPTSHFPENPNPIREGVSRLKDDIKATQISAGAKYTKISKKFVSQEALTIGKERFEVQDDFNIVLRPLTHEEIQAYASATQVLRERTARGL